MSAPPRGPRPDVTAARRHKEQEAGLAYLRALRHHAPDSEAFKGPRDRWRAAWDALTPSERRRLHNHRERFFSLAVNPDADRGGSLL